MELSVSISKSSRFKLRSMTGFFRRAHFSLMFYHQKTSKNEMLKQIGIRTNEIY